MLKLLKETQNRRRARENLKPFIEYTTPKWKAGPIHDEICNQAERVVNGEIDRLLLLCPPQHGKSEIVSRRLSAYILGRKPYKDIISASATATLAEGFGRDVRNCITSPEYKNIFPGMTLAGDSKAKGLWSTSHGGSYYAVGIGGQLFGRGGMGIIDDPFGSWEEAQSELQRDKVWNWYTGTLYNRIRPGEPIIVIQHRMHEDDLAGRLIEKMRQGGDQWEIVNLPADMDNPPWPERYDREALQRIKSNTAPQQWMSLYMQDPSPDEGIYFKREWFFRYEDTPAVRKYMTADFAVTDSADSDTPDFTEIGVHGTVQTPEGAIKLYLCMDGWSGKKAPLTWLDEYLNLVLRHKPMCEFAEVGIIRRTIEGFLKRRRLERKAFGHIEWVSHIGDKSANARALQSMASMGLVGLPLNDYGDYILEQLIKFPAGKYDDAVDMCALMARAIDEAHPMLTAIPQDETKPDRWEKAFDDDEEDTWKVA
ncbi:MAG: terminase family protein [Gammaproteobacteria bacterium]|nr:terminase family protein [Gammaproteobacteria bacterium]